MVIGALSRLPFASSGKGSRSSHHLIPCLHSVDTSTSHVTSNLRLHQMSSFTREAPEGMEDSFFDPNLFGLEQPAVSPPVTPTVFPEHADLSQGRSQSILNHGWPNGVWEPSRRTSKEPRRAAAQQHNASAALPPSGLKSGHHLVKQFLNVAQRARSTADERLEEFEQR